MAFSYNIDEVSQPQLPSTRHEIRQAKKYLMKQSPESNNNLFDHLSELLAKILAERPKNALEVFEKYSEQLKYEKFNMDSGIREIYIPPPQYEDAKKIVQFFKAAQEENDAKINEEISDDLKKIKPDLLQLNYYLEQMEISLPRSEIILLDLSIHKLIKEKPIKNVRLWGKILGRPKNYYIVEAELSEEELLRRRELEADKQNEMSLAQVQDDDGIEMSTTSQKDNVNVEANVGGNGRDGNEKKKGLDLVFPPLPRSNWKPPPVVPTEQIGTGLNKMVYFVCNSPGLDEWIELMSVTPQQIVAARQIVRCFTGSLETLINTYPKFPGNEGNYLRAQIARISGSTHVSPIGYFIFEKDEEEIEDEEEEIDNEEIDEEEVRDETIVENAHYDIVPVKNLVDPSMSNWCHHSKYILEQGRTTWWDVSEKDVNEDELDDDEVIEEEEEVEEEEDEIEDERHKNKKEIDLPLLIPLSEDIVVGTKLPAWTTRLSSEIQTETAIASIRSNIWPGAFAFAINKIFGNIYIGWGQKYNAINYQPPIMPTIETQYKIGPEIMEIQDPSIEAEGNREKILPPTELEGEDSLEETEEDEEDDEDESDD